MAKKVFPKQVHLTKQQNLLLKRLAMESGVSESEVIRRALRRTMEEEANITKASKLKSVHMSKIAEKVPGLACLPSRVRRLQRFWRTLPYECENGMRLLPGISFNDWQVESCV